MIKVYFMSVKPLYQNEMYKAACDRLDTGRLKKVEEAKRTEDKILRVGTGLLLQYAMQKSPVFEYGKTAVQDVKKLHCKEVTVNEILESIREPEEFSFTYGPHGKPYLKDGPFFSLSHSGNYVLCTLSHEEVGADIQKIPEEEEKRTKREKDIAERFFTKRERLWYQAGKEKECRERFYRIWTGKEAYMKWTGNGLTEGLSSFEVNLEEGVISDGRVRVWEPEVPKGYVAAVCKR